jgi:undecaprenyl-diphosphatase
LEWQLAKGTVISIFAGVLKALNARGLLLLTVLGVAAGLTIAFGQIAEEVLEGDSTAFDRTLLLALRNPADLSDPLGPPWLEEAARDITALGSYSVLGLVVGAVAIYLVMIRRRAAALWLLASVVGGAALSSVLKIGFDRPRPDIVAHVARVFTMSFPSGHAALSAVVYLTLGALLANSAGSRVQRAYFLTLALLLTMLVGITRIYLGVHYPTDVLAGWCFGAAWAILCCLGWFWLESRKQLTAGTEPSST